MIHVQFTISTKCLSAYKRLQCTSHFSYIIVMKAFQRWVQEGEVGGGGGGGGGGAVGGW